MKRTFLTCILTIMLGVPHYGLVSETIDQNIIFNQNNFESDTDGDLPGSVHFVQNSVMPSQHGVENDVFAHPISTRKTMILFSLKGDIAPETNIILTASDSQGQIVCQGMMLPPEKLTKIAGQTDFDGEITTPTQFDKTISDNATLSNFANDPEGLYFAQLFADYDALHIKTSNGNWTRNFHLPKNNAYTNKTVTFTSNAASPSTVYYRQSSLVVRQGNKITLKNVDGIWYAKVDVELNKIAYSDTAFSVIIPAEAMQPGLQLTFTSGDRQSNLTNVNIGAPNELIVHTIDLGMLTPPRDQFSFQKNPELHRQYFQQIPVRRLIVSQYEPQHLIEVMLPNGRLLTDFDPSQGGIYKGTMRQRIAKVLISHGIDNANYGVNSSGGTNESWHPYSSVQLTAHNAVGKYANGIKLHGLSGGNGMVTLRSSVGNELSHEFGHNYGLGHYPGGFKGAINRPANEVNSTWGWDAHRNRFIPNFEKDITNTNKCYQGQCASPFAGHRFGAGSMSGGKPLYPANNGYTLHTPYELNKIQNFFERKAVFNSDSPTGFTRWDGATKLMQPWNNLIKDDLASESDNTVEQIPYKQGVAVATLVGYYDPNKQLRSYIYPALHGSFGAVYEDSFTTSSCQLNVFIQNGDTRIFNLHARRLESGNMNKFHVNVEEALKPYAAEIFCDGELLTSTDLEEPIQNLRTSVITTEEKPTAQIPR